MSTDWRANLPPQFAHLPAALGFGPPGATDAQTRAIYEAARAVIAIELGVSFDIATSGARPGLQDTSGARVDHPEGQDGIDLALAGLVATHHVGRAIGNPIHFNWACSQAEAIGDVASVLRARVAHVEAQVRKHWHAVTKIAASLEAGDRVPSGVVRSLLREAKSEN